MVQSDTLFRRSDLYLDEDNNNEDITLLPDDLFVNLINLDLQYHIAASDSYDWTAANAIKLLQADRPTEAQSDLSDWTVNHIDDKPILFYCDKCYVSKDLDI